MLKAELSPKTIDNYAQVVKLVVASALDKEGEEIHPRKWNHNFMDMPVVEKAKQNTPCFSREVMTGLKTLKSAASVSKCLQLYRVYRKSMKITASKGSLSN